MSIEFASIIVTVALAFTGYLITYLNSLRLSRRAERLDRINKQLAEFYGPMFALTQAGDSAWDAFRTNYRPGRPFFLEMDSPSDETDLEAFRLWMSTVFMPINLRLYELILTKSNLLIESEMPQCLLKLVAHVAAYQAVLASWEKNDFSRNHSLLNFPIDLASYAERSFRRLKAEQSAIIGSREIVVRSG